MMDLIFLSRDEGTKQKVESWLLKAQRAPSADNMQPWTSRVQHVGEEIIIGLTLDVRTKSNPSEIDTNYRASWLALGAYAKNIQILAAADGFSLAISSFKSSHVIGFELRFIKQTKLSTQQEKNAALSPWVEKRHTNRHLFVKTTLSSKDQGLLETLKNDAQGVSLQHHEQVKKWIPILSSLDRKRYTERLLFFDFIKKMRFGSQVQKSADGLSEGTLGIPAMFTRPLALMQKYSFLWVTNLMGSQYFSSWLGCTRLLRHSSGVITLQGTEDSPQGWFTLGFEMQNVWLTLNARGLAVQPVGVTLLLYRAHAQAQKICANLETTFSPRLLKTLLKKSQELKAIFGLDSSKPLLVLRIGYPQSLPTEVSQRRSAV